MVTAATALVAGGDALTAVRLGASMVALQAGIGATNDVVDAPADAGRKPGKPIPAGLVSAPLARAIAVSAFIVGVGLAVPSGPALVGLALAIAAIGLAYDLRLKGTAWSWVPFAVGIPLLPVYGWLGATGGLATFFVVLLPSAFAAGAALAIGNALADVERDRAAGVGSVAIALGPRRAWAVHVGLVLAVVIAAVVSAMLERRPIEAVATVAAAGFVPLVGTALGRDGTPARRERAWEIEAVGFGLLAVAWLAGPSVLRP